MNDTKMDIQRSGETIERTAVKYSAKATKGLAKLTKMLTLYGIKMFANPLNAIKKDGPNKTLIHTPELTKEEAKVMIAKLREAEILATYREVEPSGREIRRGISIHNQEKMAKNDIKLAQWKDRAVKYERFSLLGKFCESQADKYQNLVNQENRMPAENKYIFIVNQRHSNALNEMLADIREMRLTKDFDNSVFEKEKIEYLHIDMMDGDFVPNFGLGVDYIRSLRELTSIPLDLHLMINNPEYKLEWIGIHSDDIVSIHYESTTQVQRVIDRVKKYGCKCFLAINPATPIYVLEEVLDYIDGINLLMVNPGYAGQKMVSSTMNKAKKLHEFLKENKHEDMTVEVDGNISSIKAQELKKYGASIYVAGTTALFKGDVDDFSDNIRKLRSVI